MILSFFRGRTLLPVHKKRVTNYSKNMNNKLNMTSLTFTQEILGGESERERTSADNRQKPKGVCIFNYDKR